MSHAAIAPGRIKVAEATFITSAMAVAQYPRLSLPEVVVLGRSNVGKSSLLNFLTSRHQMARVSNTPGRTRQINFFDVRLNSGVEHRHLMLVDLPGYGFAKMSHEEKGRVSAAMEGYLAAPRALKACLLLMDIRREPSAQDLDVHQQLMRRGAPVLVVVTKADKVGKNQRAHHVAGIMKSLGLHTKDAVVTSVHEGVGREQLLSLVWTLTVPDAGEPT